MSSSPTPAIRVGVVGLGLMGRRMLGSLAPHDGFESVVGFDADPAATEHAAKEFECEAAASFEALLGRDDLDLVYVATPPASHVELGERVLASGRALFLEKPLAVDLGAAERLVEAAEAGGPPAALNFPFATLPGLAGIERAVAAGEAGELLRVELQLHFSQWPRGWHTAGPWLDGDREGGFLREVFSHFAYLTQRLLGPLEVVDARVEREPGRGERFARAELRAGGVAVQLLGAVGGAAPDHNRWTLYGERRSWRLEDWSRLSVTEGERWTAVEPEARESQGAETQLDQLAALLRGEPSCLPSLREGLDVMRVVEAIRSRTLCC